MTSHSIEHPLTYRQEILEPLSQAVRQGESCAVIGAASMAKSNLVRYLLRADVQKKYLGDSSFRIILADVNRCTALTEFGFCELLLHAMVLACQRRREPQEVIQVLSSLHREVTLNKDALLSLRYLERAVAFLVEELGHRLVILVDEADEFYRSIPPQFLSNLRALRDNHKYDLSYVLFTRHSLERLRQPGVCEAFYELFSRSQFGLKPYRDQDAERVIRQLEVRKERWLSDEQRLRLVELSGGHPGLISAIFDGIASGNPLDRGQAPETLLEDPGIAFECQKLWESLQKDERQCLVRIQAGYSGPGEADARDMLVVKGLIHCRESGSWQIFSPLFGCFLSRNAANDLLDFDIEEETASIYVEGKRITGLSPRELALARELFKKRGEICSREDLLKALYPEEYGGQHAPDLQDNRVDQLVKRLRDKVEPTPNSPRYITTVRGHGYMLAAERQK